MKGNANSATHRALATRFGQDVRVALLSFRALAVRRLFLVGGPSTGGDAIKIVVIGGLIALTIIGYVASQWKKFD